MQIPGFKSKFNGREIDTAVEKALTSYDTNAVIIPSTEASPFNIDNLFAIGRFTIEYINPSVLPPALFRKKIRPYDLNLYVYNEVLFQSIIFQTELYFRYFETNENLHFTFDDTLFTEENKPDGRWSNWEHYTIYVPDNLITSENENFFPVQDAIISQYDAKNVMIKQSDGSSISLQELYEKMIEDEKSNCNTPDYDKICIDSKSLSIIHDGDIIPLYDIINKILKY